MNSVTHFFGKFSWILYLNSNFSLATAVFKEIKTNKLDYEIEINLPFEKINFMRLLKSAAQKAALESDVPEIINNFLLRSTLFASK